MRGRDKEDPLDLVLARLETVTKSGSEYLAKCPSHDDRKPSLSIRAASDGRVLLKCHAGCSASDIADAIGLTLADLFVREEVRVENKIEADYQYHEENGKLLFEVVRYEGKQFRQRRPDGKGGWINNRKDVRPVLYRLPELLAAPPFDEVYVVEGEKDADLLISKGFTATTNPGGAGKWRDEYAEFLQGRKVVILPDNDEPGRSHAHEVARSLAGKADSIKLVELPGLPPKGDVSDWFAAGGNAESLAQLTFETADTAASIAQHQLDELYGSLGLVTISELRASLADAPRWLVDRLLTRDGVSLLASRPGVGKSTLARFLALCVSRGER